MKRLLSLALTLVMALTLALPAIPTARAAVTPTPPSWVRPEEYAVFSDGVAYEPENWEKILELRSYAEAGNIRPRKLNEGALIYRELRELDRYASVNFEISLLAVKYTANAAQRGEFEILADSFYTAFNAAGESPEVRYVADLWVARCNLWTMDETRQKMYHYVKATQRLLTYPQYTLSQVLDRDNVLIAHLPQKQEQLARQMVFVTLDDYMIIPQREAGALKSCFAHIRNGRTMVPIRRVAELLGADIDYDSTTKKITMQRATDEIIMTVNSPTVTHNGKAIQMDVAPYVIDGTTYIPVRYIAEFFGQKVQWRQDQQCVIMTEDRAVVQPSNLEMWALPMGAILGRINFPDWRGNFGGYNRFGLEEVEPGYGNRSCVDFAEKRLGNSWGITDRKGLIDTVIRMTDNGHNDSFLYDVAMINSWSSSEYQQVVDRATGVDKYMFPYTKQLGQKWGSRGIMCWDLFRMSNLVQWGYLAGYVTYPEALAFLEPAAKRLWANFKSWDEAYENYLDGYNWWARNDVLGQDIWKTERGVLYTELKNDPVLGKLFDNNLFNAGVVGVPNLTAAQLLSTGS